MLAIALVLLLLRQADDDPEAAALRKACGRDFHKMRVGESFERAKKCSGLEFSIKVADAAFKIYDAVDDTGATGAVRVEGGKITRIVFPP